MVAIVNVFVFLLFFSEGIRAASSVASSSVSPWGGIQPPFPRPAFYDEGLSHSMHVSVELGYGSEQVPVTVTFSFMHPSSVRCPVGESDSHVGFNYTIVLRGKESKYPRHIGPFFSRSCSGFLNIPLNDLHKDANYTAYVVAFNNDVSFKSKEIKFATTETSWAHIFKGDQHVLIVCHFADGSLAKGCHVRLHIVNAHTSEEVETQTYKLAVSGGNIETEKCVKLRKGLAVGWVEVHDWKWDGRLGTSSIIAVQDNSFYRPCYLTSPTGWKHTTRLLLFCLSAAFFIAGTIVILVGILCRLGRVHRHFRRESYKVLQREA